jgi:sialic acid synthase SpsE
MTQIKINGRLIGPGKRTLVIAEIGVNHDGSVDRAIELVRHAAAAGADAVKLQIFSADALMNSASTFADYQLQHVDDASPVEMLRRYELSPEDCQRIVRQIVRLGMIPLATPFSPVNVDTIEQLKLPAIKIASPDLVNYLLLERAARSGRPLLVSTGASTRAEIDQTVQWLRGWNAPFALMHCISSYPTPSPEAHLSWIHELARFEAPVGYSDHTTAALAGALAVAAGACLVEKHLTYDCSAAGPDHAASADPFQFRNYVQFIRLAEELGGASGRHVLACERDVRAVSRQSLVITRDLAAGEVVDLKDLTVQRPGTGIAPAEAAAAAGRRALQALPRGTILQWHMLSDAA